MKLVRVVEERSGAWVRLILDEPRANLLSYAMVSSLSDAVDLAQASGTLKWLTFEGAGSHFSYGAKIQEHVPEMMQVVLPAAHALIRRVLSCRVPTAALVSGRCLGSGFELALACDEIIATPHATLGLPEISLAAFPPAGAALLPLRVGSSRATRAILTGESLSAVQWHDAGLVTVAELDQTLQSAAEDWFDRHLQRGSAVALSHAAAASRLTLCAAALPALEAAERLYLDRLLATPDAREGVQAWMEKRAPVWEGSKR